MTRWARARMRMRRPFPFPAAPGNWGTRPSPGSVTATCNWPARGHGPPADHEGALAVLRDAVERGITHIDTSGAYGPRVTNELIREALHPYPDMHDVYPALLDAVAPLGLAYLHPSRTPMRNSRST